MKTTMKAQLTNIIYESGTDPKDCTVNITITQIYKRYFLVS